MTTRSATFRATSTADTLPRRKRLPAWAASRCVPGSPAVSTQMTTDARPCSSRSQLWGKSGTTKSAGTGIGVSAPTSNFEARPSLGCSSAWTSHICSTSQNLQRNCSAKCQQNNSYNSRDWHLLKSYIKSNHTFINLGTKYGKEANFYLILWDLFTYVLKVHVYFLL